MGKKKKAFGIPKIVLLICIITGIGKLIMGMVNHRLNIPELEVVSGYLGTTFAVSIIIIAGIIGVHQINNK